MRPELATERTRPLSSFSSANSAPETSSVEIPWWVYVLIGIIIIRMFT
jgi:hypothetical protein